MNTSQNKLFFGIIIFTIIVDLLILFDVQFLYIRSIFSFIFFMTIPGLLILLMLKVKKTDFWEFFIYAIGLSIAFLIFIGLFINSLLPLMKIEKPLSLNYLIIGLNSFLMIFWFIAYKRNKDISITIQNIELNKLSIVFFILPLIFPISGVFGANILNNGGSNFLTLIMLGGIAVYVFLAVLLRKRLNEGIYPWAILMISISLLLMSSLRSWYISGWDIHMEFRVFMETLQNLRWSMSYFPSNPYNACLSINILPTILVQLLNISPEYIFKTIMELLYAFTAVIIFLLAKRYTSTTNSFLASFVFISQQWFFEEMPALVRQEIAFLFFGYVLLAIFDSNISKGVKYFFFCIFAFSITLSHYSSTYIWLLLLAIGIVFYFLIRITLLRKNKMPKFFNWWMLFVSAGFTFIWVVLITNTGTSLFRFMETNMQHVTDIFKPEVLINGVKKIFFAGSADITNDNLNQLRLNAIETLEKNSLLYDPATYLSHELNVVNDTFINTTSVPEFISKAVLFILRIVKLLINDVFILIGTFIIFFRTKGKEKIIPFEYLTFSIAALPLIFSILFLPIFQSDYSITRLFMQTFITLSLLVILGGLTSLKFFSRYKLLVLLIILLLFFTYSTGFMEEFVGGQPRITLAQPEGIFGIYYVYASEVYAARWLKENRDPEYPIYADIIAGLRLKSYANTESRIQIFPETISKDGYVYMSNANVNRKVAYATFKGNIISYIYPIEFLDLNKSKIYDNGNSRLYN